MPTYDTEHVSRGLSRLVQIYQDKPKFKALLATYLQELQELEDATRAVYLGLTLAEAVGVQLTILGRLVGEPRRDDNDDNYKLRIRTRVLINRSKGRGPDIIAILKSIPLLVFQIRECGVRGFEVYFSDAAPETDIVFARVVAVGIADGKSAGVGGQGIYPVRTTGALGAGGLTPMTWLHLGATANNALGFSDLVAPSPSVGGQMSMVL